MEQKIAAFLFMERVCKTLYGRIPYTIDRESTPEFKAWEIAYGAMSRVLYDEFGVFSYSIVRYSILGE